MHFHSNVLTSLGLAVILSLCVNSRVAAGSLTENTYPSGRDRSSIQISPPSMAWIPGGEVRFTWLIDEVALPVFAPRL
jgi:hypothetical protein